MLHASSAATPQRSFELVVGASDLAVVQLPSSSTVPQWALSGDKSFLSMTYTKEELSLVVNQASIPKDFSEGKVEGGWRALKVAGPLDFELVGILASLAVPLARSGVSIFAVSTYNTDYVLVKASLLDRAARTLREHGHEITYEGEKHVQM